MNIDDTIVAISSPPGSAARGIVRLSGPDAVAIADALFDGGGGGSLSKIDRTRRVEGSIQVGPARLPAAAYVFRAPGSYTRQDIVELHLLGAPGVLALTVEACLSAGARRAEPGEFTARAFLAGALDLSQVHGIAGMIAARSDHQLRAAERLLHGALSRTANDAREELAELLSLVEGALDFADEPIEFIAPQRLRQRLGAVRMALQATAEAGLRAERWIQLPRVVLVGPPNVGKSALMNRLTGLDRAICAPVAGTTRDMLSAPLALGTVDCLIVDVAGLDQPTGELGAKTRAVVLDAVKHADLILHVMDLAAEANTAPGPPDYTLPPGVPVVIVANKCDRASEEKQASTLIHLAERPGACVVHTSAVTGAGCEKLKGEIERLLHDRPVDVNDAAIALMAEHRDALDQAIEALDRAIGLAAHSSEHLEDADLVAAELHLAAEALGMLVGRDDPDDLLGRVFSRFCIGK